MAAAIAHTIAVVDKSGKVVGTSKQLKNVFMEAKFAYQERKAEIVAERRSRAGSKQDQDLRRAVTDLRLEEDTRSERSDTSRRRSSHRHGESGRRSRPDGLGRHYSSSSIRDSRVRGSDTSPRSPARQHPRSPYAESETSRHSRSAPTSPALAQGSRRRSLELVRRRTDMDLARLSQIRREHHVRSHSTAGVDMDLAYGDYHPSSIAPIVRGADEKELLTLVEKVRLLLDEANCAQHSVKAMVAHLQTNPDAMAAVALTLAEISNLATKMAPGVLAAMKGSAPAVFALLASPHFLIAAGVGLGVTVVMFGGYKIIKKIKAKSAAGKEDSMDELMEVDGDEINRINAWRRGIVLPTAAIGGADGDDAASVATSVDGEFITPLAASMRGMETREDLLAAGLSDKDRKKQVKKENKELSRRSKAGDKKKKKMTTAGSDMGSEKSDSSSKRSSASSRLSELREDGRRALTKVKKPSPLRRLLA